MAKSPEVQEEDGLTSEEMKRLDRYLVFGLIIAGVLSVLLAVIQGQHRKIDDLQGRLDQARQQISELVLRVERAEALVTKLQGDE